jgi:hypothetical protein
VLPVHPFPRCGTSLLVPFLLPSPTQLCLLAPRLSMLLYVTIVMLHSLNVPFPCLYSLPPSAQSFVLLVPRGAPTGLVFLTYLSALPLALSTESSFPGFPSSAS